MRDRWLEAVWSPVKAHLPAPPARVVELGCGVHGGFVPRLVAAGYDVVGVDPEAPEGAPYRRERFEDVRLREPVDALVACTSLHHVADPVVVLDRISDVLSEDGTLVVVEWDWTRFDERSARWCFERLGGNSHNWLVELRDEWRTSGKEWPAFLAASAEEKGIHPWPRIRSLLEERFAMRNVSEGPYFFADLNATTVEDEEAAIEAGELVPTRVDCVAARPAT
jgi:SAM-dependent methyltransferase